MEILDEFKRVIKGVIIESRICNIKYHDGFREESLVFGNNDSVKITLITIDPNDNISTDILWNGLNIDGYDVSDDIRRTIPLYNAWKACLVVEIHADWNLDTVHVYKLNTSDYLDDEITEELDKLF